MVNSTENDDDADEVQSDTGIANANQTNSDTKATAMN